MDESGFGLDQETSDALSRVDCIVLVLLGLIVVGVLVLGMV